MSEAPERKKIAVIDGNSLMHRAFHAVPPTMIAPDGRPTNAVYGFLSMFLRMIETFEPDGVICAFDKGRPEARIQLLKRYKAQRPPTDPNLKQQFPIIQDLLGALEVPVVMLQGWEGDDILGTVADRGESAGYDVYLITGDKDAYQLATKHVKIVTTKRGLSDVVLIGPEEVVDLYGITPELIPDFYGLKGDPSDNIPGVPGIGEKKASALLQQYDTLDNLIEHADEVKGKMGENLRSHIEDALVSREVATISKEAPIELNLLDSKFPTFDPDTVRDAFSELGFTSQTKRFLALSTGAAADALAKEAAQTFITQLRYTGDEAQQFVDRLMATNGWASVVLDDSREEGALFGGEEVLYVASPDGVALVEGEAVKPTLKKLFERGNVCAHDLKEVIDELIPVDSGTEELMKSRDLQAKRMDDTMIMAYLLDSTRANYTLPNLTEKYLQVQLPEPTEELPRGILHAAAISALRPAMLEALKEDGSLECYNTIEMPLLPVLVHMERNGMTLDTDALQEMSDEMAKDLDKLSQEIYDLTGEEFNIDSPKQVGVVLFEKMGLPVKKKTKTGYSTDAKVLEELSEISPVPEKILDYREKAKLKSTYLDALPKLIMGDGRIHTSYNQTVAATGRLSSSNPNLQNIPVRTELGRQIRKAFSAPEGMVFVSADYSQIELRLLAHLSEDEGLIAAFKEGEDFHSETAARVFGVDIADITPELRSRAKAVNFGIVYGQQAYGLSQSLKIPYGEAQEMIDRYFTVYPRVRDYLDETIEFARQHGWVATMFGRKRHVPDIFNKNPNIRGFGERTAMNHPMQGSAADIIKLAMIEVQKQLVSQGFTSKMVVQVHDELDFEAPVDEVEPLTKMITDVMTGVVDLKVPLLVDVSTGANWAEAK